MKLAVVASVLLILYAGTGTARERLDLNGTWQFRLDPQSEGLSRKWYGHGVTFAEQVQVPGAWQAQGVGKASGILRNQYEGTAWYRRSIKIPANWTGNRVILNLEGAHRRVTVFVNGVELGGHDGFSAPFGFDVTSAISPGADNEIVLRIENPPMNIEASPDKQEAVLPAGMLNYIANWGGIYGSVTLESQPKSRIRSVLVTSNISRRIATFHVEVDDVAQAQSATVDVKVSGSGSATAKLSGPAADIEVALPNAPLWTPDDPQLLSAEVTLSADSKKLDSMEQRFGFREVSTNGPTLLLNGKPIYLRGYGDDNVEVLTGFPPSSKAVFVERLRRAKSFGFNAVRFHSMTPPAAYFEAADEVGMLVMAELPAAYTQYFFAHRDFLRRELAAVLTQHRNHPSLLSLAFGNEFNLQWLKTDSDRAAFREAVADFYKVAKELAPGTLIMSNDGFDMRPTDMVSLYRGAPADRPTVRHEFGQYYCSLPDIGLIDKFTGVIVPEWLKAKKSWVEQNGIGDFYTTALKNSQKLQQLGRKFQIERVRADNRVSGYHYWLIVDYPGGTGEGDSWEEGWFDYFWQPKGIAPEDGRQINSPVLLMIDAGVDQRTTWAGISKPIGVKVSNYGPEPIRNGTISWTLFDGDKPVSKNAITGVNVDLGAVTKVGQIAFDSSNITSPRRLNLVLTLQTASGAYSNRWDFWAYPRKTMAAPAKPVVSTIRLDALRRAYPWMRNDTANLSADGLLVTDVFDTAAETHLKSGGRVWLLLRQTPQMRGVEFFPASGGALGTVIRNHPALGDLPHEGFCDLQFYNLVHGAFPMPLNGFPSDMEPLIGGIRTTSEFLSKTKNLSRFAYALEGTVGSGKLLITTLRFRENFDPEYPEAMATFEKLLNYAAGNDFAPSKAIPATALDRLRAE